MAQDVQIANVQYSDVPALEVPKVGGGTARFTDLSGDTLDASKVLQGYTGHDATGAPFVGAVIDGDEIGYGTEALSDLTGTTWLINATPAITSEIVTYNIDFTSNNSSFETFAFGNNAMILYGQGDMVYYNGWTNQAYRTISITGGYDVKSSDLISWLESNAVQQ